ncbi:hypothetical protein L7F22_060873 [Adiantum nelumboides]|nr:hypothetical protein [Adiantum nelumboides]
MLLDFTEHRAHRRVMQQAFTAERLPATSGRRCRAYGTPCCLADRPARTDLSGAQATDPGHSHPSVHGRTHRTGNERINKAFVDCVRAASSLVRWDVPGTRWRAGLRGRAILERYFEANLPAKRAGAGEDLFSALCQARTADGEEFSDADIVNHMIFLMMAAHDTSTITSAAVVYYLGANPQWQQRAREESLALGDAPLDMLRSSPSAR